MRRIKIQFRKTFFLFVLQALTFSTSCFSFLPEDEIQRTPMPGRIIERFVNVGDVIYKGTSLFVIESMKMHLAINSQIQGKIQHIPYKVDDIVEGNAVLISLWPNSPNPLAPQGAPDPSKETKIRDVNREFIPTSSVSHPVLPSILEVPEQAVLKESIPSSTPSSVVPWAASFLLDPLTPLPPVNNGGIHIESKESIGSRFLISTSGQTLSILTGITKAPALESPIQVYKEPLSSHGRPERSLLEHAMMASIEKQEWKGTLLQRKGLMARLQNEIDSFEFPLPTWIKWICGLMILSYLMLIWKKERHLAPTQRLYLLTNIKYVYAADFNRHAFMTHHVASNINIRLNLKVA